MLQLTIFQSKSAALFGANPNDFFIRPIPFVENIRTCSKASSNRRCCHIRKVDYRKLSRVRRKLLMIFRKRLRLVEIVFLKCFGNDFKLGNCLKA